MASCLVGFALAQAFLAANFCVDELPISIDRARAVVSVGTADMIVLERAQQRVVYLTDTDGDGLADTKVSLTGMLGLNHGLALHKGYMYASSDTTVYRWQYTNGDFNTLDTTPQVVITNMNPGGHTTRTMAFDADERIYISIGSLRNIDTDSSRSRIRRFDIPDESMFPLDFNTGEVFADGLRNEVGLEFDKHGVLWGVENGADNLFRQDIGGDINEDGPGEELNRFKEEDAGKHWGYPWCFSEFSIPAGEGAGTVWAWPTTMNIVKDQDCRDNYEPSILSMQAHSAPLGMTFFEYKDDRPAGCTGGFPKSMDGYVFIAFHGSWNRNVPTGYKVVYVPMDAEGNMPPGTTTIDLLTVEPPNLTWNDGFRPVDVDFDACGRLIVSSDGSGGVGSKIVRIGSTLAAPGPTDAPVTPAPVTSAPVTAAPSASSPFCFTGEMTVELENKSVVPLKSVEVGQIVKVDAAGKYEAIYAFGHRDELLEGTYLQLHLSNGKKLEISHDHMLFVNYVKSAVPASTLEVGNELVPSSDAGSSRITIETIKTVKRVGMYAPFTASGTIVVNGVKASTYTTLQPDTSMLTIGGIETPFSHQWLAHAMLTPFRFFGSAELLVSWIEWMLEMGLALLNLRPIVLAVIMTPLIGILGAMSFVEYVWLQPGMAFAFVIFLLCLPLFASRRSSKQV